MPRIKYPPTPATSTGPTAQEKQSEMEGTFTLPPAAIKSSPPASPSIQRKRTLSGTAKGKEELPPPPSRARKIIQMKPKEEHATSTTTTSAAKATSSSPKRKQPSASSAAGRKIARKTAHSIIERRRRSKMNEEFGVLKDMIPACKGVEMHKLAILQAGIEYVKYLQGCVEKLQTERRSDIGTFQQSSSFNPEEESEEDDDEDMDEIPATTGQIPSDSPRLEKSATSTHDYRRASTATNSTATTATSAQPSPALQPNIASTGLASQRQLPPLMSKTYSISPPPINTLPQKQTGVSPAFSALQFNAESALSRTSSHTQSNYGSGHSPNILPLPKAMMSMGFGATLSPRHSEAHSKEGEGEGQDEATATAALMMLTNDRRPNGGKGGGMSVRDLLSH